MKKGRIINEGKLNITQEKWISSEDGSARTRMDLHVQRMKKRGGGGVGWNSAVIWELSGSKHRGFRKRDSSAPKGEVTTRKQKNKIQC